MIAPGQYAAVVVGHTLEQSAVKGTWGVKVTYDVGDAGETCRMAGTIWLSNAETAARQLEAIGWDVGADIERLSSEPKLLAGTPVMVTVRQEEYQGKLKDPQISWVNRARSPGSDSRAELAGITKRLARHKSEEGPAKAGPPADEDVGF